MADVDGDERRAGAAALVQQLEHVVAAHAAGAEIHDVERPVGQQVRQPQRDLMRERHGRVERDAVHRGVADHQHADRPLRRPDRELARAQPRGGSGSAARRHEARLGSLADAHHETAAPIGPERQQRLERAKERREDQRRPGQRQQETFRAPPHRVRS